MIDWLRAVAWSLALLFLIGVLTLLAWAYWAGDKLRRYQDSEERERQQLLRDLKQTR